MAEAMTGLAIPITHQAQCLVDRVLAHGAVRVLLAREYKWIFTCNSLELAQKLDGLFRQGDSMRAAGLHAFLGDCPGRSVQVELGPGCGSQFPGANGSEHQKANGAASQLVDIGALALGQQFGQL
ncbi:hypothetical protein D9M71_491960 [compost metagenome]